MFNPFKRNKKEKPEPVLERFTGYILDTEPNFIYLFSPFAYDRDISNKSMIKCEAECDPFLYITMRRKYFKDLPTSIPIDQCRIIKNIETIDLFDESYPFITKEEFMELNSRIDYINIAKSRAVDELNKLSLVNKFSESFVKQYGSMRELREDIDFLEGLISSGLGKAEALQTLYIKKSRR